MSIQNKGPEFHESAPSHLNDAADEEEFFDLKVGFQGVDGMRPKPVHDELYADPKGLFPVGTIDGLEIGPKDPSAAPCILKLVKSDN